MNENDDDDVDDKEVHSHGEYHHGAEFRNTKDTYGHHTNKIRDVASFKHTIELDDLICFIFLDPCFVFVLCLVYWMMEANTYSEKYKLWRIIFQ